MSDITKTNGLLMVAHPLQSKKYIKYWPSGLYLKDTGVPANMELLSKEIWQRGMILRKLRHLISLDWAVIEDIFKSIVSDKLAECVVEVDETWLTDIIDYSTIYNPTNNSVYHYLGKFVRPTLTRILK